MSIEVVLEATRDLVKTLNLTEPLMDRVWTHPGETDKIKDDKFPFAVVSKMSSEPGAWRAHSFGVGEHKWDLLIAVFVNDGPIVVTNTDQSTVDALDNAHEYYEKMAELLYANMTLSGTVEIIGDDEVKLYDYVTDNLIWNGKHHWGHLFVVPVRQTVVQNISQ